MDYRTAAREINKGNVNSVYLCYGSESWLIQEFVAHLAKQMIEPSDRDLAISRFSLAETSIGEVLEDAETLPFFVPKKLIIATEALFFTGARDTGKVEHDLDRLIDYLKQPPDYSVLVLIVHADKLDERRKVVKSIKQSGGAIPFPVMSSAELTRWINRQAEKTKFTFSDGAIDHLVTYAGTSLLNLSKEIEKLSLFVGRGGTARKEDVESLVTPSAEQNVFLLIEEIVQLRLDKAFSILYELLKQREEPIKILALLTRQFRMILQAKELGALGMTQQQIASQLGYHPYAVRMAALQAQKYDRQKLCEILQYLGDLDYEMKSGKMEKVFGLELVLLKLAA